MKTPKPAIALGLVSLLLVALLAGGESPAPGAAFPGANGRIAYASNQNGNWDIYAMNEDGSGQARLTSSPGNETQPSYSPDGSQIAFSSSQGSSSDIYTMNADGSGQVRLTTDPGTDTQPSFSPDGSQIVFISKRGNSWYGDVYLMNADGSEQVRLTTRGGAEDGPTFSPDGQRIAFGRAQQSQKHLFAMNPAGEELTDLSDGREPSYSPDGQRIAFDSRRSGHFEIYAMNASGSGAQKLTSKPGSQRPAYSPDGSQIAFDKGGSIFTMNANGSGEAQLTKGHGSQAWVSWQPLVGPLGPSHGKGHASDRLRIGRPILNRRRGIARLPVTVPAAGTLRLSGKRVKLQPRKPVAEARTVKLLVKPKKGTARALARKAKVKVKVLVTFDRKHGGKEAGVKKFSLRKKHR